MDENEIIEAEYSEPVPAPEEKDDKVAAMVGMYLAAIVITLIASILLTLAFSIVPTIKFTFLNIVKCFAGLWGIMLARGALKNKIF